MKTKELYNNSSIKVDCQVFDKKVDRFFLVTWSKRNFKENLLLQNCHSKV